MKNYFINNRKFLISIIINIILVITVFVHGQTYGWHMVNEIGLSNCEDKYSYINPRFACGEEHVIDKKAYTELKIKLLAFIEEEKKAGRASLVGIFFRDLESGPTLGIDDRVDFIPASLLKLPNVLALMRLAEENGQNILEEKIMISSNGFAQDQTYKPTDKIKKNIPYSVEKLLEHSIISSDNLADQMIGGYLNSLSINEDLILGVYRDLGIINPNGSAVTAIINTKGYSSIFRMLYNVSFLGPEPSEKLLDLLGQSNFNNGLRVGVPQNIKVSHKFGERFLDTGEKHLHDCGIIYYPNNPYSLCVMTRGKDFKDLERIIQTISKMFYEEVNSRKIK